MSSQRPSSFASTAIAVLVFGIAMGYLEAVVVVYLRTALDVGPLDIVPVAEPGAFDAFAGIESVRELATLVMITAVGWLVGRSWLERLAWAAVVFGTWDIAYYGGLWVAIGWPPAVDTWDILFLLPATWVGPVWAPLVVSAALVGFGLAAARRLRAGRRVLVTSLGLIVALVGGGLVILSFLLDSDRVIAGDGSPWSAWPVFWLGMGLGAVAAVTALSGGPGKRQRQVVDPLQDAERELQDAEREPPPADRPPM